MEELKVDVKSHPAGAKVTCQYTEDDLLSLDNVQKTFKNIGMFLGRNNTVKTKSHNNLIERLRKKLENKKK